MKHPVYVADSHTWSLLLAITILIIYEIMEFRELNSMSTQEVAGFHL